METPDQMASRWARVTLLNARTSPDHEWSQLYRSLVGVPARDKDWLPIDPVGILERLESVAIDHGLMDGEPQALGTFGALAEMLRHATGLSLA